MPFLPPKMPLHTAEHSPDDLRGATITYSVRQTPWGTLAFGILDDQVCLAIFLPKPDASANTITQLITSRWPQAHCQPTDRLPTPLDQDLWWEHPPESYDLCLLLIGTPFQCRVWKALLSIPKGQQVTYQNLAQSLGLPGAARAIGQAVGANPLSILVPCHRVIRTDGHLGGYHWGVDRKRALLAVEGFQPEY